VTFEGPAFAIVVLILGVLLGLWFGTSIEQTRSRKRNQAVFHTMWVYEQVCCGHLTPEEGSSLLQGDIPKDLRLLVYCQPDESRYKN
jgi:hypothetical protein